MKWKEMIRNIICKNIKLPVWSHGLECEICNMTFVSAEAHEEYVRKQKTITKHKYKIPLCRR